MLTQEQQREIVAVGLLALALFVFLSLVPVSVLGERGGEWFPSGNTMGVLGSTFRDLFQALVGVWAILVPPLLVLAGLRTAGWMPPMWALRLTALDCGLLVLAPVLSWV
ncbi:MAG: hypothetical protein OEZ37_09030, partial [Gemmatimonadota bacterium]|nr:hypothetical protein [Gemmatimonadota bacterium]